MVSIFCYNGYNGRSDLEGAVVCASIAVKKQYRESGNLGECFAFLYDETKHRRFIVWLNDDLEVKVRKLS